MSVMTLLVHPAVCWIFLVVHLAYLLWVGCYSGFCYCLLYCLPKSAMENLHICMTKWIIWTCWHEVHTGLVMDIHNHVNFSANYAHWLDYSAHLANDLWTKW